MWIAWASIPHYPAEAAALKYIFKPDVVTPSTVAIMERVLRVEEGEFPKDGCEWPGIKFNAGEKEFFALLGTPHGMHVKSIFLSPVTSALLIHWKDVSPFNSGRGQLRLI